MYRRFSEVFALLVCIVGATVSTALAQTITATPNPIYVADGSGLGVSTISYSAPGVANTQVWVNGVLFCAGGSSGDCVTGKWVSDGTVFILRNADTQQQLASVTVSVIATNLNCGGMSPQWHAPVSPGQLLQFTVSGVQNASSVDFAYLREGLPPSSANTFPAEFLGNGEWRSTVNTSEWMVGGYKVTALLRSASGDAPCSFPGFATVRTAAPPDPGGTFCNSLIGRWVDSFGEESGVWQLSQAADGQVSGTLATTKPGCSTSTWTVTGTKSLSNSSFSITASNATPPGSGPCLTALSSSQSGSITIPCLSATGTFTTTFRDSSQSSGPFTMNRDAVVPDSETSRFLGWGDSFGMTTQGGFEGRVSANSGMLFGGRAVGEQTAAGQPGDGDGCWFNGASVTPLTTVTGGSWFVQTDNTYRTDWLGFPPAIVGYYQTYRPLNGLTPSCTVQVSQRMVMGIASGVAPRAYGNINHLVLKVTSNTVSASRAGVVQEKVFRF